MLLKIPYLVTLGICAFVALAYRKVLLKEFAFIFYLVIITFPIEVFADLHLRFYGKPSGELYWFFLPVEYALVAFFFVSIIKNAAIKNLIKFTIGTLIIIRIILSVLYHKFDDNNPIAANLTTIFIICWIFIYFRQMLNSEQILPTFRNPDLWVCIGLLIYYVGSFFVISLVKYIYEKNPQLAMGLWNLMLLLNIIMYSCFIVAFRCQVLKHNFSLQSSEEQ